MICLGNTLTADSYAGWCGRGASDHGGTLRRSKRHESRGPVGGLRLAKSERSLNCWQCRVKAGCRRSDRAFRTTASANSGPADWPRIRIFARLALKLGCIWGGLSSCQRWARRRGRALKTVCGPSGGSGAVEVPQLDRPPLWRVALWVNLDCSTHEQCLTTNLLSHRTSVFSRLEHAAVPV